MIALDVEKNKNQYSKNSEEKIAHSDSGCKVVGVNAVQADVDKSNESVCSINSLNDDESNKSYDIAYRLLGIHWWVAIAMISGKLLFYINTRMFYAIGPFLEADWNITAEEMGLIIASGEFGAIPAGFLGPFANSFGPRVSVLSTSATLGIASVLIALFPVVPAVACFKLIQSLCLTFFASNLQAIATNLSVPSKSVRLTGYLETSWGLSLLVFVPLIGILYGEFSWQAPFYGIAILQFPVFIALWIIIPRNHDPASVEDGEKSPLDGPNSTTETTPKDNHSFFQDYKDLFSSRKFRYYFFGIIFMNFAHNIVFTAFSYWAKDVYNQSVEETSSYTFAIGAAELTGVLLLSIVGDRYAAYKLLLVALFFAMLAAGILGVLGDISFGAGLMGFFFLYLPMEFATVISIAMAQQLTPPYLHITALLLLFQAMSLGRTLGAFLSPVIWERYENMLLIGLIGTSIFTIAWGSHFMAHRLNNAEEEEVEN